MRHEVHGCDFVNLPFDTTCTVLDRDRRDILERATQAVFTRAQEDPSRSGPSLACPRPVSAPLERRDRHSAVLDVHWIQADPTVDAEGGLSAWLNCHLRLLPRQAGDHALTEVLLAASCETSPRESDMFTDEICEDFLESVATEIERHAVLMPNPR